VSVPQIARALEDVGSTPLGLFLDDFHWVPEHAASMLLAAIRLAEAPVLLVATVRTPTEPEWAVIPESTGDLPVDRITVTGLDEAAAGELTRSILGKPLLASAQHLLWIRTGGNPLFIAELLRAWNAATALHEAAGGYLALDEERGNVASESIEGMVASRLRRLDTDGLSVVRALAVLGRDSTFEELFAVTEIQVDALAEILGRLADEGLLSTSDAESHPLRLAHPIFESAILRELGPARAGRLHARIYTMLRSHQSGSGSSSELAHHAVKAKPTPPDLKAILREAATGAETAGSFGEAEHWYGHLIELTLDDPTENARALGRRAAALEPISATQSIAVYGDALDVVVDSDLRTELLLGRALAFRAARRFDEALDHLKQAAEIAPETDRISIRHQIAVIHGLTGNIDQAEAVLRDLIDPSSGTGLEAKIIGSLSDVAASRGEIVEAMALSERAQALTTDRAFRSRLRANFAWDLLAVGRWSEADVVLAEEIQRARGTGDLWRLVVLLSTATILAAWRGRFHAAFDLAEEGTRAARRNGIPVITSLAALGTALLEQGQPSEVVAVLSELPALVQKTPEKWDLTHPFVLAGEAQLLLGDEVRARANCDDAERYVQGNAYWAASVDRLRAQILLAAGDPAGALAVTDHRVSAPGPIRFEHARLLEVSAHALVLAGRREEGSQRAQEALRTYEELGAESRAQRLRDSSDTVGPKRRGRPRSTAVGELTEREREVLTWIAKGKTNREIAQALTISHATVKKHVENIKLKIGVARRTELARSAERFLTDIK